MRAFHRVECRFLTEYLGPAFFISIWLSFLVVPAAAQIQYTPVRINEIHTGVPDWVELINIGVLPVDIGGWSLHNWSKGLESFQWEDRVLVIPDATILDPGQIYVISETESLCYHTSDGLLNWNSMEGIACLLEDEIGRSVDSVVAEGYTGMPEVVFEGEAVFLPPYPVRDGSDVIRRSTWPDSNTGLDWTCDGNDSMCCMNPGQPPYVPVPPPLPAASFAGIAVMLALIGHLLRCRSGRSVLIWVLFLTGLFSTAKAEFQTRHAIMIVIDGLRFEDAFVAPNIDRLPNLNGPLRSSGTFCSAFYNIGIPVTTPGHAATITGACQPVYNNTISHNNIFPWKPTIFEYYRAWLESQGMPPEETLGKVLQVYGKDVDCRRFASSLHPGYGTGYSSLIRFPDLESGVPGPHRDARSYQTALECLEATHPHIALINLAQTDQRGHYGVFDHYEYSFRKADEFVASLWKWIQSDPVYTEKTTLFVLTDHGRHDDAHDGFRHHGCNCHGCRHCWMLVLGPDTPAGEICSDFYHHEDIVVTIGRLLDFPVPFTEGRFMSAVFPEKQKSTRPVCDYTSLSDTPGRSRHPSIAIQENHLAVAWMDDSSNGDWQIFVKKSCDSGSSWSGPETIHPPFSNERVDRVDLAYRSDGHLIGAIQVFQDPSATTLPTGWRMHLMDLDTDQVISTLNTGLVGTGISVHSNPESLQVATTSIYRHPEITPPFHSEIHVLFQESTGSLVRHEIPVNNAFYPHQTTIDRLDQNVTLAYVSFENKLWNAGFIRSTDGGISFEHNPALLAPEAGRQLSRVAIAATGARLSILVNQRIESSGDWAVELIQSLDSGGFWLPPVRFSETSGTDHPVLVHHDQLVLAAWSRFQGQIAEIRGRMSFDAGITWTPEFLLANSESMVSEPDIALSNSFIFLVFTDHSIHPSEIEIERIPIDRIRARSVSPRTAY